MHRKRILVAALNWGLGHATRCIPVIEQLQANGYEPIIASDGSALLLLKKEFPHLTSFEFPSYEIRYSKTAGFFKWKMIMNSTSIINAIKTEKVLTEQIVKEQNISGIISDNRLGVRSNRLDKNVFITHQLNVLSGNTTFLSSYLHQTYINKFDQCWVPDFNDENNLSGILGHLKDPGPHIRYMGVISRLKKEEVPLIYDYLVLLSGPEPQRSLLEAKLLSAFERTARKVLFIRGVMDEKPINISPNPNINIKNYLYGQSLQHAINGSKYVISRSGYTSLMDFSKLEKKVFLVPTPGQKEQEYLAEKLEKLKIAPFCEQDQFSLDKLEKIKDYSGLRDFGNGTSYSDLFTFFESE